VKLHAAHAYTATGTRTSYLRIKRPESEANYSPPPSTEVNKSWSFNASSEAFTAMFQVDVFWGVTPCSEVLGYKRFGVQCCLHLQCQNEGSMDLDVVFYLHSSTRLHSAVPRHGDNFIFTQVLIKLYFRGFQKEQCKIAHLAPVFFSVYLMPLSQLHRFLASC